MLGLPQVSVEADLIDDLGLTSLDMLRLVTEANKKGCPINVSAVYTARNLRRLLLNNYYVGSLHVRISIQSFCYFSQFDAKATYFDLSIFSPDKPY